MDLGKITTDEKMGFITGETDRWEFKGAELLDPKNKHDLKVKIGEQVSAFANSDGGFIAATCSALNPPHEIPIMPVLPLHHACRDAQA